MGNYCTLGQMTFHQALLANCRSAKTGAHPVGKKRDITACIRRCAVEIGLRDIQPRRRQDAKTDQIEAVTGIELGFERRQSLMEQFADEFRLTQRTRGADRDPAYSAIHSKKLKLQPFGPLRAPFQIELELFGKQ